MVAQVCNHQILKTEAEGLLLLPGQANLEYSVKFCLKQTKGTICQAYFSPEDSYLSHLLASPVPALPLSPAGGSEVLCTAVQSFTVPHAQHTFWG